MIGSMQDKGNGKYRLYVSGGYDGNGKRIRFTKTVKATSKKEAEKLLNKFVIECMGKDTNDYENIKLREFANQWIEEHVKKNLAPKTVASYISEINHRIIPTLGNIKLKDLKPLHLIKFYNSLDDAPRLDGKKGNLSPRAKQNIHRILSSMLNDAVKWQVIKENPASRLEPPKNPKKQAKYYDEKQAAELLSALDNLDEREFKWKVFVYIALFAGLRTGLIIYMIL